ncbi:MAG TPA: hypothetical protein VHQ65_02045 [Thermoanaerobaculia bacterium]|nr:hypothetical protein [Thermoanaerobaculia bacterium]
MAVMVLVAGSAPLAGAASGKQLPRPELAPPAPLLVPGEWVQVEAGVQQRLNADGSVETYATGVEGMEFHARELQRMIREARQRYAAEPDPELRDHVNALVERVNDLGDEILEARSRNLGGGLTPLIAESTTCTLSVGYSADARPGSCGPEAAASGSFNHSCGHFGDITLTSYAQGWRSGLFRTASDDHPRAGTTGSHSDSVSSSVDADTTCFSEAYAEVRVQDSTGAFSTWFQTDTNSVCRTALGSGYTGPTSVFVPYGSHSSVTWYASGTADSYAWYVDGSLVGTGSSYTRFFPSPYLSFDTYDSFDLKLTVTRCGQSASTTKAINVTYAGGGGGSCDFEPCCSDPRRIICEDPM